MKVIKIKKNGEIFLEEHENENVKVKNVKSLKKYLACEVEFEKGLTFGTLLKLIIKEGNSFNVVFCQELNGKKLEYFEEKFDADPEVYEEDFKLEYLEISKIFELFSFEKGSTIDLFSVFIGIGKTNDGFDVFIPLSFYSIAELKDMEVMLNKLVEVYRDLPMDDVDMSDEDDDEDDDEDESVLPQQNSDAAYPFFEAAARITLYEVIQCIIYELSYYKTDEERITVRKNQNNEQINKNKIALLELQLKKHVEGDEFEKAAIVKRELDRLKTITGLNKN